MDQGFVGLINPVQFCLYDIYKGKEDVLTCNITGVDFFSNNLRSFPNVKIIYKLCIWK
jgi:hypothetical protein